MSAFQTEPSHYLLRGGQLIKRATAKSEPNSPKTIHYTHTVRMIGGACQHQAEIESLKQRFQREIEEKNQEIQRLSSLLGVKDCQIRLKNEEIDKLKAKLNDQSLNKTQISSQNELPLIQTSQVIHFHRRRLSDNIQVLLPDFDDSLQPEILRVKDQMRSTMETINNISQKLQKPKRKYQFYNTELQRYKWSFPASKYKQDKFNEAGIQQQTNELNETFIEMIQETCIHEMQPVKGRDSDLDLTFEDDSQDNVTFLEKIIEEHVQLRQALLDLQQMSKIQLKEMKTYYQNEIQTYIEMLNKQAAKATDFNLNSTRTNIYQDSEELDNSSLLCYSQEESEWGKDNRFQIIFPDDNLLEPDIIQ